MDGWCFKCNTVFHRDQVRRKKSIYNFKLQGFMSINTNPKSCEEINEAPRIFSSWLSFWFSPTVWKLCLNPQAEGVLIDIKWEHHPFHCHGFNHQSRGSLGFKQLLKDYSPPNKITPWTFWIHVIYVLTTSVIQNLHFEGSKMMAIAARLKLSDNMDFRHECF